MAGKGRLSGWVRRRAENSARAAGPDLRRDPLVRAAASAGFPVAPAAHPSGFGCSCERIGCPIPGVHPVSPAWQTQASTEQEPLDRWLRTDPLANFVTATGVAHDVLDVPAEAGRLAIERLVADGATLGPVAVRDDRLLFFTATRGNPADEDEWWPCELDSHPETADEHPGIRWHSRGSYVLLPPSRLPSGGTVEWLPEHGPDLPLPDPLPVLDVLADACAQFSYEPEREPTWLR